MMNELTMAMGVLMIGGCLFLPACGTSNNIQSPQNSQGINAVAFYSAFMDSDNRMHFYSSTDQTNGDPNLYYNSLFGNNWQFSKNMPVTNFAPSAITSTALGTVLYDVTAPFNGYEYVMYFINQPQPLSNYWSLYGGSAPCIIEEPISQADIGWGLLYVQYSHSPDKGWTTPCQVTIDGVHAVRAEEVSAVYMGGTIYLTLFEGSFSIMTAGLNNSTYAYMATVNPASPNVATRLGSGYYSMVGVTGFNPNITLTSPNTTDDDPMMFNLDTGFDPVTKDFYITRSYAYPFDATGALTGEVPCNSSIPKGMATFPNRSQLYKMNIGNDFNNLYTGTWTLVEDYGQGVGYSTSTNGGACTPAPIQIGQTNIGGEVGTMSILRTPEGYVHSSHQLILSYGPRDKRKPYIIRGAW